MKRLIVAAAVGMLAVGALAQGQLSIGNRVAGKVDSPIFDNTGAKLDGAAYFAQAYAGLTADSLTAIGAPLPFRSGAAAGYLTTTAVTVPFAKDGVTVQVQLRAWEAAGGNSYEAALAAGKLTGMSNIIPMVAAEAPNLPPAMVGLTSFSLVPEPSTLALGVLGVAALLLRRRN